MSRATEIAEREAAAAEAEEPENPDAEPVEPLEPDKDEAAEEEEKPAEPSSLAQIQAMDKALEAEQKRHRNALAKALGSQFEDFAQCPLCQVDGYAMPYQPGEVGPEQRDAILTVMGEGGPSHTATHPSKIRCDACDGWGKLYTGSRDPAYEFDACIKCGGSGTMDKMVANQPTPAPVTQLYPWDTAQDAGLAMVNRDSWGRPQSHPDFGLDPVSIVSTHVAG